MERRVRLRSLKPLHRPVEAGRILHAVHFLRIPAAVHGDLRVDYRASLISADMTLAYSRGGRFATRHREQGQCDRLGSRSGITGRRSTVPLSTTEVRRHVRA